MMTVLKILGVILLLVIGFVIFVFVTLDPEELGQKFIQAINEKGGIQVQAESFQISPLKGLIIENAHAEGELATGSMTAELGRVVVDYQLLPILKGEIIVDQIVIERPRLVVVSHAADQRAASRGSKGGVKDQTTEADAETQADEESSLSPTVSIASFRVEDGSITSKVEGPDPTQITIDGLNLELTDFFLDPAVADPILGLSANGSIRVEAISTGELDLEGSRGNIAFDHGLVTITDFGVDTDSATLQVSYLEVDLRRQPPPFTFAAGGECDVNSFVDVEGEKGFGPAALQMSISGIGPALDQIAGNGTLRLESGEIPAFPLVVTIERLLGKPLLTGSNYQATDIPFTVAGAMMQVQPFTLVADNFRVSGLGQIDLAGPLDLEVTVQLRREEVNIDVLDPFINQLTDEKGWTTVPFKVDGTMGEPEVGIDVSTVKDAAVDVGKKAISDVVEDAIDDLVDKYFKRDKKKNDG